MTIKYLLLLLILPLSLSVHAKERVKSDQKSQVIIPYPKNKWVLNKVKNWIPYVSQKDFAYKESWEQYHKMKSKLDFTPEKFEMDLWSVKPLNNDQWIVNSHFQRKKPAYQPIYISTRMRVSEHNGNLKILCFEPRFTISDDPAKRIKLKLTQTLCG